MVPVAAGVITLILCLVKPGTRPTPDALSWDLLNRRHHGGNWDAWEAQEFSWSTAFLVSLSLVRRTMGNNVQAESIGVHWQFVITIGADLCETFFFAFLCCTSAYRLQFPTLTPTASKRPSTPVRNYMLAVSAFMYAVSAVHWAMNMAIVTRFLRVGRDFMSPFETLVVVYLPTINYILSDGIVVWRAWVLWGPSRRFTVFIPPLFSLVCTLVLSAAGAAYLYIGTEYESERDGTTSRYLGWTVWGLSHRQFVRSSLGKGTATSTAEKVLIFVVESGALYLCIWAVYIISTFTDWNGVPFLNTAIVQVVVRSPSIVL
ncbi:hypothetical protein EDB84DRAFT_1496458 [Lactarius hengduanensis]|nr:hypothetical protein EDB84DRAFT_1496458 [Lactarius hengduanensis]